ncbi:hypothetical protein BIW11_13986 [Tropilaelaps mercedesae]|uniref:Uncharacterized protein n=1 Tax=Tropilaelaps mercedesae TaxID=418985 RepID=A0A1V9WZX0_9ACAR|nr:hypothetical protein BIW11_13986 [Tropilaelaps mercedesae]
MASCAGSQVVQAPARRNWLTWVGVLFYEEEESFLDLRLPHLVNVCPSECLRGNPRGSVESATHSNLLYGAGRACTKTKSTGNRMHSQDSKIKLFDLIFSGGPHPRRESSGVPRGSKRATARQRGAQECFAPSRGKYCLHRLDSADESGGRQWRRCTNVVEETLEWLHKTSGTPKI